MGVEISRMDRLPSNIDDDNIRKNTINYWNSNIYKNINNIQTQFQNKPTLTIPVVIDAINIMYVKLKKYNISNKTILEIGSGNGIVSKMISNDLKKLNINLIGTDLIDFNSSCYEIDIINSVDAIIKYGTISDILLLFSPLPCCSKFNEESQCYNGYYDYFAIHDYIKISTKNNYIIFIGELGAGDGSSGLYLYLLEHEKLELLERVMISKVPDTFTNEGFIEKEFFLFQIKV
jgi:hypothetical protein